MKLLIRQRVFSWSDTYDVYDEDGQPKYYVGEICPWVIRSTSTRMQPGRRWA